MYVFRKRNGKKKASWTLKSEFLDRQQQKDADIVMESETLSLKCPVSNKPGGKSGMASLIFLQLSFSRIKLPCRSVMCKHAQCFDATAFLAMNEQTPTWSCPVCYRQIESFDDLIADGFYADVLEKFGTEIESFKIDSEGNIQLSDESKTHLNIKQEENTTFISVDSAFAAEGSKAVPEQGSPLSAGGDHKLTLPPLSSPASPASQPSSLQQLPQQALPPLSLVLLPGAPSPRKEVEVIDLTLDSDDD
ncbi:MIZ/SP-RING zinc finger-domain-containing protein [Dichotomocladium elegans]|nr:MIZ/SP-RING zinc finger-domain-containing protein [Dichotomocladium elegans]